MWKAPIVEEVRKHREAHAAKFDYDISAICRDLRRQEKTSGRKTVSFPAKHIPPTKDEETHAGHASEASR